MRIPVVILAMSVALAACGGDSGGPIGFGKSKKDVPKAAAQTQIKKAVLVRNMDFAPCLKEPEAAADQNAAAASTNCPTFVLQSLEYMQQACSAGGGTLQVAPESNVWQLDVNGDGKNEVLLDLSQNLICYGAPAALSCGSIGCPFFLYSSRGDGWTEWGAINPDDAPSIELLPGDAGKPATLRGGCLGDRPCTELTHYAWNGSAYVRSWIEARGNLVDVVPGGLWTITKDSSVLTAPGRSGQALDEYPAGTTMVVIGNARKGDYKYVSPCNTCRRGFVETALLKKQS